MKREMVPPSREIVFTENDIEGQYNRLAPTDGRILPRFGQGPERRTGKCLTCGVGCWPYVTCRRHRELGTMRRALKKLEAEGLLVRVTDGRGRKGGSTWRASEIALKRIEEEKEAKTIRRDEPKTGRNDPCKCGSGKKYKRCCLQRTTP